MYAFVWYECGGSCAGKPAGRGGFALSELTALLRGLKKECDTEAGTFHSANNAFLFIFYVRMAQN
jgi:hypothetical protein